MFTLAEFYHEMEILYEVPIAFSIIAGVATCLRFYTRIVILKRVDWEDFFALLSMIGLLIICVIVIELKELMMGLFSGKEIDIKRVNIYIHLDCAFYPFVVVFTKLTLSIFFLKIFTLQKLHRFTILFVAFGTCLMGVIFLIITFATCGLSYVFTVDGQTCPTEKVFTHTALFFGGWTATTDLVFSLLAVLALRSLKLPFFTKLSAITLLLFGTCGGIASFIRFGIMLAQYGPTANDITNPIRSGYWSVIELGVGVAAVSFATLRPLFSTCLESRRPQREAPVRNEPRRGWGFTSLLKTTMFTNTMKSGDEDEVEVSVKRFSKLLHHDKSTVEVAEKESTHTDV